MQSSLTTLPFPQPHPRNVAEKVQLRQLRELFLPIHSALPIPNVLTHVSPEKFATLFRAVESKIHLALELVSLPIPLARNIRVPNRSTFRRVPTLRQPTRFHDQPGGHLHKAHDILSRRPLSVHTPKSSVPPLFRC